MAKPLPDGGGTNRDAIDAVKRQTGVEPPEGKSPCKPPRELLYLWGWFWEAGQGRPVGMGGLLPIPPSEILAWATLRRIVLEPFELQTLQALDAAFMRVAAEK